MIMERVMMYCYLTAFFILLGLHDNSCIPFTEKTSFSESNGTFLEDQEVHSKRLGPNLFRQLLNQETLIRMALVKNVDSIMTDMVALKENMVSLQRKLDYVLEKAETDKSEMEKEITLINLENKRIMESIERIDKELLSQNATGTDLQHDLANQKVDMQRFEKRTQNLQESFEDNTTSLVSSLYNQVHVLSMSVIKVDEHSQELSQRMDAVNTAIPGMIEEKITYVLDFTRNLTQTLSEGDRYMLKRMNDELEETKLDQLKMSAAVLSLEWQKDNNTSKCDSQQRKTVAFTAGFTSSSYQSSGILKFNKVILNIGDGYDPTSGVFIAPSDGVYVFYVSVTSHEYRYIETVIYLNGNAQVTVKANGRTGNAYYQTGTNMVVLLLVSGDRVWVQWNDGDGYTSYSVPLTTFSGFLI